MEQVILDVMREALLVILKVSAPILLVGLIVGLIVSIFQTVTSIQEQTLAFIPKIIAVFLSIIIFGSWIMTTLVGFTSKIFHSINEFL
jgi:flagellar biosynthetic protein FliQ